MFGAKYCEVCGMKVEKGSGFERFGKRFCSEGHAQQYVREVQSARQGKPDRRKGGCC